MITLLTRKSKARTVAFDENPKIGPILKDLRKADGLKLSVVASAVGTTVATLSAIETSRIENPGYKQIFALAKFYGVTIEYLTGEESTVGQESNSAEKLAQRLTPAEQQTAETFMRFLISRR